MGKALIIGIMLAAIKSCQPPNPAPENPRAIWCATNEPRRDARPDTPRWVVDEINAHNRKGVQWCGWTP